MNVLGPNGEVIAHEPAPIAVVSDNGPCFRGEVFKKYEHLYRGIVGDDDALDMVVHRFR